MPHTREDKHGYRPIPIVKRKRARHSSEQGAQSMKVASELYFHGANDPLLAHISLPGEQAKIGCRSNVSKSYSTDE